MDEFIDKEKHKPAESYNIFMKTYSKQQAIISQIQDFRKIMDYLLKTLTTN